MEDDRTDQRMRRFEKLLRENGLKVTHQRLEVFRYLASSKQHPEAETVYRHVHERIPAVSRDTVYRTLSTLEQLGLVHKAEVTFGPARYDANIEHHHHFVCTECGLVRDISAEQMNDLDIPDSVARIGNVNSYEITLRGLCHNCKKQH